jgi:hypothetical protein
LSDFEVTDEEEEEDIFAESEENVLSQAREETSKWYQSWDKASTSKEWYDAINDPDDMSQNSETFDSMGSEEDEEGEHHPRKVRRYLEWKLKRDLKEKSVIISRVEVQQPYWVQENLTSVCGAKSIWLQIPAQWEDAGLHSQQEKLSMENAHKLVQLQIILPDQNIPLKSWMWQPLPQQVGNNTLGC